MTYYYSVLVASARYHGSQALTYSSSQSLKVGCVVEAPLQRRTVMGVVLAKAAKPAFKTRGVSRLNDGVPALPLALLKLTTWIQDYYPAPLGATAQQLLPPQLTAKTIANTTGLAGLPPAVIRQLPPLTAEQGAVLEAMAEPDTYLLHGDTGSGKTRVYIELACQAVQAGRSAIILTPEISLTSQLAASFSQVFRQRVVVVHSRLSPKARATAWLQIARAVEPLIVLGPRSALFSPLPSVGLIVVDEAHEPAYKQDQAPHYQAVRVASQLASLHKARLVLGSATPLVTDYYIAQQKHKPILRMRQIAAGGSTKNTVTTTLVDIKDRTAFSRSPHLSTSLLTAIGTSLQHGQQSLLYLNRRGTARVILCNTCGWQASCPHCDLPLTYHHDQFKLQCHSCGHWQPAPLSCPACANTDIVFKVVGTKAIEADLRRLYPSARIQRFDTDNLKNERFEQHYQAIQSGEVDILVGTQLLAKGLDLPHLTTLGVVVADTSLTFPDFSAEERTYQLLAQVIGRVGRGHAGPSGQPLDQHVVIQSYDPTRPVITAALTRDWDNFYSSQLNQRQSFGFPPFYYLLKLSCRRATAQAAEQAVEQLSCSIEQLGLPLLVEGPMPSFHTKAGGKFEWQLVVKSRRRPALLVVIQHLKAAAASGWSYDIDPANLL